MGIMNSVLKQVVRARAKQELKKMNIPIPKGKDVFEVMQEQIDQHMSKLRGPRPDFDKQLALLPLTSYQVVGTCEACEDVGIIGETNNLNEAVELAVLNHEMKMDEDNVVHNHRTAVLKIIREIEVEEVRIKELRERNN